MRLISSKLYITFFLFTVFCNLIQIKAQQNNDSTSVFPIKKGFPDPYMPQKGSAVDFNNPNNYKQVVEYDPESGNYIIRNYIGDIEVGSPTLMSFEEYKNYNMQQSLDAFWRNKLDEETERKSGGPLDINIGLGKASAIFGEGGIQLKTQGYAELQFGIKTNRIDNPALSEDLRSNTIFDFDEKIVLSVNGSVGDRIKLNMDYNTEATFDFDNTMNLNYQGKEDDIVKKVEAGNVSLPLSGSLIRGSQSLFGLKTELQFGKLRIATVFSQQESETETMTLKGGATASEFEIRADEYDANRHFFLTHHFEKNYNDWMKNIPVIMSGLVINRIEVWVTNKRGDYDNSRNIVAFMDLAEPDEDDIFNTNWSPTNTTTVPDNNANSLFRELRNGSLTGFRDISSLSTVLANGGLSGGVDYEKVENARLLSSSEYTLNRNLGYISLNTSLNSDEVLAVAFEYQYLGKVHVVGEFSTDSIRSPNALALKMLKGTNLSPEMKTWDLMMKNIYSLNARQVSPEEFRFEVMFRSDSLGTNINYIPEDGIRDERLLNLMKLDRLNSVNEIGSDGFFDWVPGLTIIPDRGKIIFPVTKPFSSEFLSTIMDVSIARKYAYDSLYTQTVTNAAQSAEQNKFVMEGSYRAASGSEIKLNAFNIPRGSVVVTAGGRTLVENVDYTVDYASGYLKILNQSILESGTPIQVSMENNNTFSLQKKTMLGTHLDYRFSDDFNVGATLMHLYERPLTQKVGVGEDPIANTIWGFNGAYKAELPYLTKLIDKLPFIETKAPSSISVSGEIAQLIPGHANVIGGGGAVYLDDFEATKIGVDIKHYFSWKLSSTPKEILDTYTIPFGIETGKNRARIAWYTIDRLFQIDNSNLMPAHIKNDVEMRSNHYMRAVNEQNLFPNRDNVYTESTLIPILNVAYYPQEKGPYNFNTDLDRNTGYLNEPEKSWGGIMRRMETTDFEQANIEYIEFWVMDPFIEGQGAETGGELVLNLGDISEDVLKDGRKSFEHGLPATAERTDLDSTVWGFVPRKQSLTPAFANTETSRQYQDIGLDGLSSEAERDFFNTYYQELQTMFTGNETEYIESLFDDVAQDDYRYYRSSEFDDAQLNILDRYKYYNNVDGNSPISLNTSENFATTGSNLPDVEDINQDNTLSESENFYEYRVKLDPNNMRVGQTFITDIRNEQVKLANGREDTVKWYQFRVPVNDESKKVVGSINGFKSIRFMRMYLTDFNEPVILRFASLELVRGEWRQYTSTLDEIGENNHKDGTSLEVGSVNIEENSDRQPVNYVLPPGVDRVIDPGQPQLRELNEQSMSLKVKNLAPQDARAVYKTMSMDMRQFKRIKMWVHAEEFPENTEGVINNLEDNDLSLFIRLGSDFKNNYYEYEIPLALTPSRIYDNDNEDHRMTVWPLENELDVPFELLTNYKLKRNKEARAAGSETAISKRKGEPVPGKPTHWMYIKGNPTLSEVRTIMIGVRNKRRQTNEVRSGEIWVNELRLSEFDEEGGWAGIGSMALKLADLGSVNMSGSFSTAGFGGLEQNLMERQIDDLSSFDISTNLQLGKFFPEKAQVSLPIYYSYSKDMVSPKYNPLDEDVKLQDAIDNAESQAAKDSIQSISQDVTIRRSVSLSNVRVGYSGEKKQFFDPNNFSANFAYNETERKSPTIEKDLSKNFRGGLQYSYSMNPKPLEPFRKIDFLKSDALALVRDFNLYFLPTQMSFRTDMNRNYNEMLYRDVSNSGFELPLSVRQDWNWNRQFDIRYKLSNSLNFSLTSQSNAIINERVYDELNEPISLNRRTERAYYEAWQDTIMRSIREWGRAIMYHQVFNASYDVPFSKVPILNWVTLDGAYTATYDWDRGPNSLYRDPEDTESIYLGHTIQNNRNIAVNSSLNFTSLYAKSKFLADANQKYGRAGGNRRSGAQRFVTARYEKEHNFPKGQKVIINHKLGSDKPNIRIYDENNRQISGDRNIIDENSIEFTSRQDVENARVVITARVEEKSSLAKEIAQRAARVLMGVKSASASYTRNSSLVIPGFNAVPNIIGQDMVGGYNTPGYAFAFGDQNLDIIQKANERNWLVDSEFMTDPYVSSLNEQFRGQASVEPINGLKITLNTTWAKNEVNGANYLYDPVEGFIADANRTSAGNFSMTWISIGTAFKSIQDNDGYTYEPFEKFANEYRSIMSDRTNNADLNSQDVLIPAFLAAYSGKDPHSFKLSKNGMPDILGQLPNWSVRYDGLSKIPALQKYFRNVVINHSYMSTYNMAGFRTNLVSGQVEIPTINITESLSPLINIDATLKNSLSLSAEISKNRNLMLNISSNQVVETVSNELSIGAGYRWDDFNLIINSGGRSRNVSNDLNLRADFSLRDMKTIIRKIEENYNQPSTGQNAITFKFTADYTLSRSVTIRLFYDRQAINPLVSTAFSTATSNFGLSFKFQLIQ